MLPCSLYFFELEIFAPICRKEESMEVENKASRGEDGQMMTNFGQTEQWRNVHGWRETGRDGERWSPSKFYGYSAKLDVGEPGTVHSDTGTLSLVYLSLAM